MTYDALSGTADYRIFEGQPQSLTDTLFTVRPLTVKGKKAGPVTLKITLTDAGGHAFTLSIPYTLTEEDTRVTATLQVDEQALPLSVPYGSAPSVEPSDSCWRTTTSPRPVSAGRRTSPSRCMPTRPSPPCPK